MNNSELSEVATLASETAVSLDNLYSDRYDFVDKDVFAKLSAQIRNMLKSSIGLVVLHESINKYSDKEIRYQDDLTYRASLAAQEMSHSLDISKERIASMRSFCVSLSRISRHYYSHFYGHRRRLAA